MNNISVFRNGCVLPPYPKNGNYIVNGIQTLSPGTVVDQFTYISFSCNKDYDISGSRLSECNEMNQWSPLPSCHSMWTTIFTLSPRIYLLSIIHKFLDCRGSHSIPLCSSYRSAQSNHCIFQKSVTRQFHTQWTLCADLRLTRSSTVQTMSLTERWYTRSASRSSTNCLLCTTSPARMEAGVNIHLRVAQVKE